MKKVVIFLGVCAFVALFGIVAVFFTACKKDAVLKKEVFSGYAQKGPFIIGSSVTIMELDNNLDQTGKTYHTTISDKFGGFEEKNIELISNYVELKAEGQCYSETDNSYGVNVITLYALVDVTDVSSANVNVLTHLEKPRVEYLVKQGMSFAEAKQQAQQEVLAIFGLTPSQTASEEMNVMNDAMLLAISCIVESTYYGSVPVMELMANISADVKTNGILDNNDLGKRLIKNAIELTSTDRYNDGLTMLSRIREGFKIHFDVTAPDFESYIQAFLDSGLYQ